MATKGTRKYNVPKRKRSSAPKGRKHYEVGSTYTADVFHRSYTQAELLDYRRKLAKVANQRMVRLERGESMLTGNKLTYGSYDVAMDYLKKGGRNRFSEVRNIKNMNDNQIRMEIEELERFLNAKSSTVKGFHEIEEKRLRWAAQQLGMKPGKWKDYNVNDQQRLRDFYNFMESETYKNLAGKFSSTFENDFYERAKDDGMTTDEILSAFEEFRSGNQKAFREMALSLGFNIEGLFKK